MPFVFTQVDSFISSCFNEQINTLIYINVYCLTIAFYLILLKVNDVYLIVSLFFFCYEYYRLTLLIMVNVIWQPFYST